MGEILIGTIIGGILWGVVVNKVIENKGYKENWFWWGFFFSFFALIIALTKPNIKSTTSIIEEKNTKILSGENMIGKVDVYSPVHIVSWSIKKDDNCDARLFVDFLNVSEKAVSAVMLSAIGLNSFGDKIFVDNVDSFDIIEQDLTIKSGEYGSTHTVLSNSDIRKVELKVKKVCFADGTIYESNANKWININQSPLHSTYLDCVKRTNSQAEFHSIINQEYWQCVCGFVNTGNECKLCSMQKETALEFSKENIGDTYQKYIKDLETEKRAQEEQYRLAKKAHIRNRNIVIATLCISILFVIMLYKVIIPDNQYKKAKRMMNDGNYVEAVVVLNDILDYKDSLKLKQVSLTKISKDASNVVFTGWTSIGLKSDGTVVAVGDNQYGQCNVEDWKDIVSISAEAFHTVGLKSDRTVVATGSSEYGQCNVEDWKDIVAVSAGSDYTVGLKSDGTVVAVGNNEYGQCNVQDWKDIVAIFADFDYTVGLKSDGTVVAVGNNKYGQCNVEDWKDIISLSTAYSHTVGLKSDGTVVATGANGHGQCNVQDWKDVVVISAEERQTVGLKSDGTVVAVGGNKYGQCDVQDWEDVVYVFAEYNHTIGLKSDGTVLSVGDNEYGQCNVQDWKDIVTVWTDSCFTVGLKSDRTFVIAGENRFECYDIKNWDLNK